MVNKKHAEILKEQMQDHSGKKKGKMNMIELLQNKERLREIAEKDAEAAAHLKKAATHQVDR